MFKIAINGFGRIGKLVTRRLFDLGLGENLVLINEQAPVKFIISSTKSVSCHLKRLLKVVLENFSNRIC